MRLGTETVIPDHATRSLRFLLDAYAGCELPQWDVFATNLKTLRVPAGSVLFAAGEAHPYIYFVHHGLFKAQLPGNGERPRTVFFAEEGDVMASLSALGVDGIQRVVARGLHSRTEALRQALEQRTAHTCVAIESSVVHRVNFRVINHLASQHLGWAKLTFTVALMHATTLQADAGWLRCTPEQRYRSLMANHPSLVQRVTQRDLASYLNVTEAAFSRIAKRVRGTGASTECLDDEDGELTVLSGDMQTVLG